MCLTNKYFRHNFLLFFLYHFNARTLSSWKSLRNNIFMLFWVWSFKTMNILSIFPLICLLIRNNVVTISPTSQEIVAVMTNNFHLNSVSMKSWPHSSPPSAHQMSGQFPARWCHQPQSSAALSNFPTNKLVTSCSRVGTRHWQNKTRKLSTLSRWLLRLDRTTTRNARHWSTSRSTWSSMQAMSISPWSVYNLPQLTK